MKQNLQARQISYDQLIYPFDRVEIAGSPSTGFVCLKIFEVLSPRILFKIRSLVVRRCLKQ